MDELGKICFILEAMTLDIIFVYLHFSNKVRSLPFFQ